MTTTDTPNAEPLLTTEQFRTALGGAAWSMTLQRFCGVLGWAVDDYAKAKYLEFQQVGAALSQFDPGTLRTLVEAQLASKR